MYTKDFCATRLCTGLFEYLIGRGNLSEEAIGLVEISECQRIQEYFKVLMISGLI